MTEHFYIASRLAKIQCTDTEAGDIHAYIERLQGNQPAQDQFFEYCNQWKLAPWIYIQLGRLQLLDGLTPETQQAFAQVHAKAQAENESRNAEALKFLAEFKRENIDVVILKGNLLIHTVYHDTGYKRMNDFDLLVHPEDWGRIQEIYLRLGFIPLGFGWSGEKEKPAKFSHIGMSFISSNLKCIVGTQWGLKSPTTRFRVDIKEAWQTAEDFDFYGLPLKKLSIGYNLLHLVLHMGIYKCGIRDCMDVSNLLLSESRVDETALIQLLSKSNALEKAYFTLMLTQLCAGSISQTLLDRLKPAQSNYHTRRLEARLRAVEQSGDLHVSYTDHFQDIEKEVIYFNLFPKFHRKAVFYYRLHRAVFFPGTAVALKLADQSHSPSMLDRVQARVKAPGLVLSLVAQEIGWGFTVLLLLKVSVDWVGSIRYYFFKKESYFDFLRKQGVAPEAIEQVVKGIQ